MIKCDICGIDICEENSDCEEYIPYYSDDGKTTYCENCHNNWLRKNDPVYDEVCRKEE